VIEAKTNFAEATAEVAFDPKLITEREIEKAVEEAGFSVVKPGSSGSSESRRKRSP
jgi:copper chaperone CopZ